MTNKRKTHWHVEIGEWVDKPLREISTDKTQTSLSHGLACCCIARIAAIWVWHSIYKRHNIIIIKPGRTPLEIAKRKSIVNKKTVPGSSLRSS